MRTRSCAAAASPHLAQVLGLGERQKPQLMYIAESNTIAVARGANDIMHISPVELRRLPVPIISDPTVAQCALPPALPPRLAPAILLLAFASPLPALGWRVETRDCTSLTKHSSLTNYSSLTKPSLTMPSSLTKRSEALVSNDRSPHLLMAPRTYVSLPVPTHRCPASCSLQAASCRCHRRTRGGTGSCQCRLYM